MDEYDSSPHDDRLNVFAEALGVDPKTALRALGGGWEHCEVGGDVWPVDGWAHATWFATGKPLQVLAGVHFRSVVLARPVTRWDGVVGVITAVDLREFAREDVEFQPELLADAVEALARASRRRFRWCRTCHTANAPETMLSREECMDCGERYRGVVY
jgi:hypothetical protein